MIKIELTGVSEALKELDKMPALVEKAHKKAVKTASVAGYREGLRAYEQATGVPRDRWRFAKRFYTRVTSDGDAAYAWFGLNDYPILWVPSVSRRLTNAEQKTRRLQRERGEKRVVLRTFADDFDGPERVQNQFTKTYESVYNAEVSK